jgi:hypothetical protein
VATLKSLTNASDAPGFSATAPASPPGNGRARSRLLKATSRVVPLKRSEYRVRGPSPRVESIFTATGTRNQPGLSQPELGAERRSLNAPVPNTHMVSPPGGKRGSPISAVPFTPMESVNR